jgi:hypothetical protein
VLLAAAAMPRALACSSSGAVRRVRNRCRQGQACGVGEEPSTGQRLLACVHALVLLPPAPAPCH